MGDITNEELNTMKQQYEKRQLEAQDRMVALKNDAIKEARQGLELLE